MSVFRETAPRPTRRLRVRHTTEYRYDQPMPRSIHRLHLKPIHDRWQALRSFRLNINPFVQVQEYEDVFGNHPCGFEIATPYTRLTLDAESVVELAPDDPFAFAAGPVRPTLPVAWMPWERKMLGPYMDPPELPETQLRELVEDAQAVASANGGDLLETLFAFNLKLFRTYEYAPGSTGLRTTPYETFAERRGVCQDFANLFICWARLLSLPARYVYGYIHTGNNSAARAQSDATHAWVEVYVPQVGWRGFDPTNGVLPHRDHVRVGVGRNFRDCTPTSGTLFGNAKESMTVSVVVEDVTGAVG